MILDIFVVLLILSLVLIFFGYYIGNPILEVVGFIFLFLLGFVISGYHLQYQSGVLISGGNYSFVYTDFDDSGGVIVPGVSLARFLGLFTSLIGILGVVITLTSKRLGSWGDEG